MRFLPFILVATGLHVLIPVVARIVPESITPIQARSSGIAHRTEIDIEDVPVDPTRPDDRERPPSTAVAANDVTRPRATSLGGVYPDNPTATNPEPPSTAEPPAPSSTSTPSAPPDEYGALPPGSGTGALPPGLGGAPIWSIPGVLPDAPRAAPAPTTIPQAPPVDRDMGGKLIREAMREKDRGLGLDLPGAGTIGSVIAEVIRSSSTPDVARATFEVRIAPGGQIASVRVVRTSAGNAGDWSTVAHAARAQLSSRQFTLPSAYASGAIVMVEAVSKVQYPDGTPGGGPSFTKGGPGGGSIGGGVNFDTSNIGARPKRHVAASVSARPEG